MPAAELPSTKLDTLFSDGHSATRSNGCGLPLISAPRPYEFSGPIPELEQIAICTAGWVGAERSGVKNINDEETLREERDAIVITRRAFRDDEEAQDRLYQHG
jgi:hypothetical protein